jgi:HTH-type transcriptional regulator/antitoxin HigA
MKTTAELTPLLATHPGEIIKDELIAIKASQSDFAKLIGIERSQLNEIIKGKRGINAKLALLLEKTLGIDADFWMEAQKNYEMDVARIKLRDSKRLEAIEKFELIKDKIAYKFLRKEKVLSGDPMEDLQIIQSIYQIEHFEQLESINVQPQFTRFRKSSKLEVDPINIIGWTKLVQHQAKIVQIKAFNHENLGSLINELKLIINLNKHTLERIQNCLQEYGIKLIYQAKGEKTPVDGISFWSEGNPAIGMSLWHKRIDNFAFTLFHELGHVFKHLTNSNDAQFIDLNPKQETQEYRNSAEEKEADQFAEKNLISDAHWEKYVERYGANPLDDKSIMSFSKEIGLHPFILRGRICHKLGIYNRKSSIDKRIE